MLSPEEIREKLQDRVIKIVSEQTGLHYNTVLNIRNGTSTSPSHKAVKALSEYFEDAD